MSRSAALVAAIVPSLIAGGLLFGSTAGHAEGGRGDALAFWPAASDTTARPVRVAQVDPWARTRPRPPIAPAPPAPPTPPAPLAPGMPPMPPTPPSPHGRNHRHGHGVSVSIHDGKIELDGLEDLVQAQLERVADVLDNLPDVPPDVRERVKSRVRAVRDKLRARLGKLKSVDLDHLGPEMERMGDEIEKEMEGLDKDLAQFGDRFGKHFAQKFGRDFAKNLPARIAPHDRDNSDDADDDNADDDDKDAVVLAPDHPTDMADPSDLGPAIADLKDLVLDQTQKMQLTQLRLDSDRRVADAKRELETMSERLHDALGNDRVDADDVARQIDLISQKEATIRKARILTWIKVRGMLDKDQRKKVEAAARHH
jgi:hypothetical protein